MTLKDLNYNVKTNLVFELLLNFLRFYNLNNRFPKQSNLNYI